MAIARLLRALLASMLLLALAHTALARTEPPRSPLDQLLTQAKSLADDSRKVAAYELLQNNLTLYAGIPQFDYFLGIYALDAGQRGAAILALERVLLVEPNHLQARAELARAYLASGEREASRRQFETVAAQSIPSEVRRVIDSYLASIAQAESAGSTSTYAFVEAGLGWDSNVNFGSQSGQWLLADGTAVTPLPVSQPRASSVLQLSASAGATKPMGGRFFLTYGGTLSHRSTPGAHTLDQQQLDLSAALRYRNECHDSLMQTQLQALRLDDSAYRNAFGLTGQWRCDVGPRTQVGVFVQAFDFRFPGQAVRDARRDSAGFTLSQVLDGKSQTVVVAALHAARERTQAGVAQLDHDDWGIRLSVATRLDSQWRGSIAISRESRRFLGEETLFGVTRRDQQTDLRIAAEHNLNRHWTITPAVSITRNASTLAPNDFQRTQALVSFRYRF